MQRVLRKSLKGKEANVSILAKITREGNYLASTDTNHALIGELLARNLQVRLSDELVLLGQGRDGSIAATVVEVKGIFSSGQDEYDRSMVHIPLKFFQDVYSMSGSVHEAVIVDESLEAVPEIKQEVAAKLSDMHDHANLVVLDWKELMPGLVQAIKMDLVSGFIFYIILVVVAFSILNTFLCSTSFSPLSTTWPIPPGFFSRAAFGMLLRMFSLSLPVTFSTAQEQTCSTRIKNFTKKFVTSENKYA